MMRLVTRSQRRSRLRKLLAVDRLEARQLLATITPFSVPINPQPVEGASFSSVVARFTDSDGNTDLTKYSATILWGDGTSSAGTVSTDPRGGFDVNGTHTYGEEGAFTATVQFHDTDGDSATAKTTNVVADAPITVTGVAVSARQHVPNKNVVVAKITDADPGAVASDFVATIDWGDGATTTGVVVPDPVSGFDVLGTHTFTTTGSFSIHTSVHDGGASVTATQFFTPISLQSDGLVPADHTNANLVNPWGLAASATSPMWVADNGTGVSTLTDGAGNPVPLVVSIPPAMGGTPPSAPTGIVFNGNANEFLINGAGTSAHFIFATEDGTIAAWNSGTSAVTMVDNSQIPSPDDGAVYKGLALLAVPSGTLLPAGDYLFASNFRSGHLDVFDSSFHSVTLPAGAFHDPTLPAGYAPFGVQALGGKLYVTYALQDADKKDDVAGPGHGFVDVYNTSGFFIQRLGGAGTQLELNSPWAVTQAPAGFGQFAGDLLVGNFGDSHISVFNPTTGAFLGQLSDSHGHPIRFNGGFKGPTVNGLWGLIPGNTSTGFTNRVYFASGINDEADGLFGSIVPTSFSTGDASSTATVTPPGNQNGPKQGPGNPSSAASVIVALTGPESGKTAKKQNAAVDAALESLR